DNGNNLLFKEGDLQEPLTSAVFRELLRSPEPEVQALAERLLRLAQGGGRDVPPLETLADEVQTSAYSRPEFPPASRRARSKPTGGARSPSARRPSRRPPSRPCRRARRTGPSASWWRRSRPARRARTTTISSWWWTRTRTCICRRWRSRRRWQSHRPCPWPPAAARGVGAAPDPGVRHRRPEPGDVPPGGVDA